MSKKKRSIFYLSDNIKIFISLLIVLISSFSVGLFIWNLCYPGNLSSFLSIFIFSLKEIHTQSLLRFLMTSGIYFIIIWVIISFFINKVTKDNLKDVLIRDGLSYLPCLVLIPAAFLQTFFPQLPNFTLYQSFIFVLIGGSILPVKLFLFPNFKISISSRFSLIVISFLIISYIAIFTLISFTKLDKFLYGLCDLGMFTHVMWNTINGKILYFQVFGKGINFLGEHMSPILLLLVPFYWVYPDPKTLLFIQTVLISFGAIPVYLIAISVLKDRFAGLCFVVAYLFYPFTGRVNLFEFHEVCFVIPFLLFCFYFLQRRNYKLYYLFMILSLSVKEEISIAIFMIGLYAFLVMREKKLGLITIVISIIWALLAIKVLIPFFRGGEEYSHIQRYVTEGGGGFLQIIQYYLKHPLLTLKNAFGNIQIVTLCLLLVPLGLLPLFAPKVLCLAFPLILLHFLSTFELQQALQWQYSASIIPFLIIAGIYGLRNIIIGIGEKTSYLTSKRQIKAKDNKKNIISLLGEKRITFIGASFILSTSVIGSYFFSHPPFLKLTTWEGWEFNNYKRFLSLSLSPKDYSTSIHRRLYFEIKKIISDKASLSVQDSLAPELCNRENVYQYPSCSPEIEYFFLDVSTNFIRTGSFWETYKNNLSALLNDVNYQLLFYGDGFYLFCKKENWNENILLRYEKALEKKPKRWERFYVIGVVYSLLGKWSEAKEMFKSSSEIDLNLTIKYLHELGNFHYEKKELEKCMSIFELIVELNPKYEDIEMYNRLARIYHHKGMIDKTIIIAQKIIKIDPKNIKVYNNLGLLYYKKGLSHKARELFNNVLKLDPHNSDANKMLQIISNKF